MAAPTNFSADQTNGYTSGLFSKVAANSIDIDEGTALKLTGGSYLEVAAAGDTIEGISVTKKVFDSDNVTVAMAQAVYDPKGDVSKFYRCGIQGLSILFAGDIVASNSITMDVNGVAMTPVVYNASSTQTMVDIATQLTSQFGSVLGTVTGSGARTLLIPTDGLRSTVTIDGIAVTLGASQTTGAVVEYVTAADVGKFYDITTGTQLVNGASESASSGQLRLEKYISPSYGIFSIANT